MSQYPTHDHTVLLKCLKTATQEIHTRIQSGENLSQRTSTQNLSGDNQISLDVRAHEIVCDIFDHSGLVAAVASEEVDELQLLNNSSAPYVLRMDPLDGSKNLEKNLPVGSIFALAQRKDISSKAELFDVLGSASSLSLAAYSLYGPRTEFVSACRDDRSVSCEQLTSHGWRKICDNLTVQSKDYVLRMNGRYFDDLPVVLREAIEEEQSKTEGKLTGPVYSQALISDMHALLTEGGIFAYPGWKLRPCVELAAMAFLFNKMGARTFTYNEETGQFLDMMEYEAQGIHEQRNFYAAVGSRAIRLFESIRC